MFANVLSFRGRRAKLAIPPWSDEYRPPVAGPEALTNKIDRLNFLKAVIASALIAVLVICILLSFAVMMRMNTFIYVADGSRFGCRLEAMSLR